MFYRGECVRSAFYGLAELTVSGEDPVIRLIGGAELHVPGDSLTIVPFEVYDAEAQNRWEIERFLDMRLYGFTLRDLERLPRPAYDLAAAMVEQTQSHGMSRLGLPADSGRSISLRSVRRDSLCRFLRASGYGSRPEGSADACSRYAKEGLGVS